ncbi:type IVB secretion system protein IcmH/DotU [Aquabacterium sp.]|uniref:type IVB secretion system protein IcmH/DotU n=1 Tax=Aquabacterium sp. TaxID=1872578 RepID=UPI00248A885A|nr:type IVB secretion system protein IcmH/DotU [Aquabacterium sp.]MDI1258401.1 type IVB secretion system protein IcmH/DotU [Aquabacterium sp.]
MSTATIPTLNAVRAKEASSLLDLMYDGFYLLFLLKAKHAPIEAEVFRERVKQFLTAFERGATRMHATSEDIYACKYAFCATVDEAILMSSFKARESWQRLPLQLQFFGEQLAGEQFFVKLEDLRSQGVARVGTLEVFHMCLLLGFQGKYLIEGTEKLGYLTARLGDEISRLKGKRAAFAPSWAAPDQVSHQLKHEVPLWVIGSVFGLLSLLAFVGLRWNLNHFTQQALAEHHDIVQLAPQVANITITLP